MPARKSQKRGGALEPLVAGTPELLEFATLPFDEVIDPALGVAPRRARMHASRVQDERATLAEAKAGTRKVFVSALSALDDDEALAFWNESRGAMFIGGEYDARNVSELVGYFGPRAMPGLLRYAEDKLAGAVPALTMFISARVARYVALAYAKKLQVDVAESWLLDFPEAVSIGLIPVACGRSRTERPAAITALKLLARHGRGDTVRAVAARYGDAARAVVEVVFGAESAARPAALPPFVTLSKLPLLKSSSGERAAPDASRELIALLQQSTSALPHPGLVAFRTRMSAETLREFAWALCQQWLDAGADPKHDWALLATGHLGDDVIVERLLAELDRWQSRGASGRAATGLDAISLVGTDLALARLDHVARKSRYRILRANARGAVERLAQRAGISPDDLEDLTAPDLGLGSDRTRELTVAGARFTLSLDGCLKPVLRDASGAARKSLPAAKTAGDRDAHAEWKAFVKSARAVAESQVARLERAMVRGRRWGAGTFERAILGHPVIATLARSVLWGAYQGGALATAFRVAADGSLRDAHDAIVSLEATSPRGVIHPIELDEDARRAWIAAFDRAELEAPFPQLHRATFWLTPEEARGRRVLRAERRDVPWDRVSSLERNGFEPRTHDGLRWTDFLRQGDGEGPSMIVTVRPGLLLGDRRASGEHVVERAEVLGDETLGALSAVAASEVLAAFAPLFRGDEPRP